ncbi:hypothetical protein DFH94DRAFT_667683 [Russula ochroleuca]|uniref:Zn(2)-C6 fungal-type domain-containing protein n=1 Tax=Russula ochroleuca TaxID=152965 RepID=A0A9P5MXI2_9AGAM|nr:hypothetical protein DFH94DRAFT_667683 [Russula ochroleuca]
MNINGAGPPGSHFVKKLEPTEDRGGGKDIKPVRTTLNRVPRSSEANACRKQKMRCEGAENPPCKRCRQQSLECLFEKPNREASLTGEAGLERIRSLESHVADIRQSQTAIQNTLVEIVNHLRAGSTGVVRSPSAFPPTYIHSSPNVHADSPGSMSTPVSARPPLDAGHPIIMSTPQPGSTMYASPPIPAVRTNGDGQASQVPQGSTAYQPINSQYHIPPGAHPTLPPLSSMEHAGPPRPPPDNLSSVRHQHTDSGHPRHFDKQPSVVGGSVAGKRPFPMSTETSADSSDEDDDGGELPASGLVAPWEVLRGLADVAIQRAAKENGEASDPQSRTRSPSPDPRSRRPSKRRRYHQMPRVLKFPDVVSKGIISEAEATDLFKIFFHGCSTFLPVFDSAVDTFASLHERSPFAVDSICMVAARVRDGGGMISCPCSGRNGVKPIFASSGKPSDVYTKCLQEVQTISCATLFAPVLRVEAVQAMSAYFIFSALVMFKARSGSIVLVSGWSDNGWLSGGHAVRMALELSLHKSWPKLLRRIEGNKASDGPEDRELIIAARTWFCLYLFEHQLSYGTGRPAILTDDESIWQCRLLLRHPLAIDDDTRLVSMVELMAIRERITNHLSPFSHVPVDERTFEIVRGAYADFKHWYQTWDQAFSQKYEDAGMYFTSEYPFYRQSLQIQQLHAELYHSASALRGINGPEDVQKMPSSQREVAIKSIQIARQGLDITVKSDSYREGMKYAVHYTHATATFAASFLLRLARLFPNECKVTEIREQVETLASLMSKIPGKRYALTLQLMLKRSMKRRPGSSRSPKLPRETYQPKVERPASMAVNQVVNPTPISPSVYDPSTGAMVSSQGPPVYPTTHFGYVANADYIWRGFEATSTEQLPVWLSDSSLGGSSFSQSGIDAFLLPNDYLPPAPQIW